MGWPSGQTADEQDEADDDANRSENEVTHTVPSGERGGALELSTERPIDRAAVEAICCLPDDLYRLRWVSYAYHDIATRLAAKLGANATWPAFARWSAYTISAP